MYINILYTVRHLQGSCRCTGQLVKGEVSRKAEPSIYQSIYVQTSSVVMSFGWWKNEIADTSDTMSFLCKVFGFSLSDRVRG